MKISTKQIALVGILSAITGVMAATGLGFFSVPNVSGAMTIMHIPTIIAGAIGGPVVGAFTGFIFGVSSQMYFGAGLNVVIIFVPRILIGIASAYVYKLLVKKNIFVAASVAGFIGTAVNTIGVLGLILVFNIYPFSAVLPILALNFPIELAAAIILSGILIPAISKAIKKEV